MLAVETTTRIVPPNPLGTFLNPAPEGLAVIPSYLDSPKEPGKGDKSAEPAPKEAAKTDANPKANEIDLSVPTVENYWARAVEIQFPGTTAKESSDKFLALNVPNVGLFRAAGWGRAIAEAAFNLQSGLGRMFGQADKASEANMYGSLINGESLDRIRAGIWVDRIVNWLQVLPSFALATGISLASVPFLSPIVVPVAAAMEVIRLTSTQAEHAQIDAVAENRKNPAIQNANFWIKNGFLRGLPSWLSGVTVTGGKIAGIVGGIFAIPTVFFSGWIAGGLTALGAIGTYIWASTIDTTRVKLQNALENTVSASLDTGSSQSKPKDKEKSKK